jgi:hypothetical protein
MRKTQPRNGRVEGRIPALEEGRGPRKSATHRIAVIVGRLSTADLGARVALRSAPSVCLRRRHLHAGRQVAAVGKAAVVAAALRRRKTGERGHEHCGAKHRCVFVCALSKRCWRGSSRGSAAYEALESLRLSFRLAVARTQGVREQVGDADRAF